MIYSKKYHFISFSAAAKIGWMLLCFIVGQDAQAQCTMSVTHLSGTQQIGCTSVTVTSAGEAGSQTFCGIGPYYPGDSPFGSFTFTFSPPVAGVSIDLTGVDNSPSFAEEVQFDVNGVFYPITAPGILLSCPQAPQPPCIILPNGRVAAQDANGCAWKDQPITETISTLTITNVVTLGFPAGHIFKLRFCEQCCPTNAGVLAGGPLQVCVSQSASFSPATQTNLESNDLLQYVLYSNPTAPAGSILATSNTPAFSFNPATMQTGVTYYLAAIAGNGINGNVDLNDPCLDFSNALTLIWQPLPTVTFSTAQTNICGGVCQDVAVNLTGTPPFTLTYSTPFGGQQSQTFTQNSGVLQVCPPVGFLGALNVQAVSLVDANCVCN